METINRMLTNICSDDLEKTKYFYSKLFEFNIAYESDWFIHLASKDKKLELGIIDKTNEIVPEEAKKIPQGFYITFVVNDVDVVFKIAESEKFEIVNKPTDTFYGQRRLILKDPNGTIVDVSSPINNIDL
ncbi:VOC family protein [Tenacibaculum sp. M341]|uniref:VOC family protein n=1 Tax=Tenacibaculum sp. M341 TaxID=2530339 RepID=UPI00104CD732|nr:VOC family protein [Tenacibaculum sp. M341]TCI90333.1 hypothetical protein EYW44_13950 [Tenacibaculum sp. M341]